MATVYDAIDLIYSWNGDYLIGPDGDFLDTASDQIVSMIQEVQSVINSDVGDWKYYQSYGSSLSDFIGSPNNRDTVKEISSRIRTSLITNSILQANDFSVQIIPIDKNKVLILVNVQAASTVNNSIVPGGTIVLSFVYDYLEQGVFFVNSSQGG